MAHGFLSYQDNRGEVDYLGKIYRAIKDFLDEKEKREKRKQAVDEAIQEVQVREEQTALPGAETPLLTGGNQTALPPSSPRKMLTGSALERSLPGSVAVKPTVVGGSANPYTQPTRRLDSSDFASNKIVDISSGSVRSYDPDDNFMATSASGVGGGTEEIVQAIDRLTFVTLDLVQATQQQTRNDALVAQQQARQASKIAEKSRVAADKAAFTNDDFSGNLGYTKLAGLLGAGRSGSGGRGLSGFGMKAGATAIGKMAMKRGGARAATRLGAGVGMKLAGKAGARLGARMGAKALGGVVGKKLPFGLGLAVAGGFAADRFAKGDVVGGIGEVLSGLAAVVPGVGTAASLGIDGLLAARDFGLTPFNQGGIPLGQNVPALLNDRADGKPEAVMPLTDAIFESFGEGILNAQKKNKRDYARLQALGLEEYANRAESGGGFNLFDPTTWGKRGKDDKGPNWTEHDYAGSGDDSPVGTVTPVGRGNYGFGYSLPATNTTSGQNYGASRDGGDRSHAGTDFDISGAEEVFASQIGGVVTFIGNDPGGYGKYVDIVNEEKGVTERIAEGAEILPGIEIGAKVRPGQPIVKGETNTGVIHYEIRRGGSVDNYQPTYGFSGTQDPMEFLKSHTKHNAEGLPANKVKPVEPTPAATPGEELSQAQKDYAADKAMDSKGKAWSTMLKGSYGLSQGQSIEFGPNKEYKATKLMDGMGWKFQRKVEGMGALLGGWRPISTIGKNLWLRTMFLEAVKDRVAPVPQISSLKEDSKENDVLQSAAASVADPLNKASQETSAASRQPPIVTVVTGDQSQPAQPGGNRPTAVPTGISASDTGTETFSKAKTMLID